MMDLISGKIMWALGTIILGMVISVIMSILSNPYPMSRYDDYDESGADETSKN